MKVLNGTDRIAICKCGCTMEYDESDIIAAVVCPNCLDVVPTNSEVVIPTGDNLDKYSWEEISKMRTKRLALGATKTLTLKNGDTYTLWVVNRTDGLVLGFKDLYGTDEKGGKALNEGNGDCTYKDSTLRKWLNNDFYDLLPDDFKAVLATASVQSGGEILSDKVFIPSETEYRGEVVCGECKEGEQFELYKDWHNRIAGYPDGDYGRWHWNRTKASAHCFCDCNGNGVATYNGATNTHGVRPHFLIKK
ncbi:MAG: hypothetical protein K2O89_07555 [Clostridia bacterium]|nr:hypothetical protein [Clostridia bacterium]